MKSNYAVIFLAALVSMLVSLAVVKFAGTGSSSETVKESVYDRVMRTGKIRCGYGLYEPGFMIDAETGAYSGLFYELTEKIGELMSLEIIWAEEAGWSEMAAGLNANRYDLSCAGNWVYAPQGRRAGYSMPIHFEHVHGYVRNDDFRFDGKLESLNDPAYKIATIDGEISFDIARDQFPNASRVELPALVDFSQAFLNVTTGKADAVFLSSMIAEEYMKKNPGKVRQFTTTPVRAFETAYMFKSQEPGMRDMLNAALRELRNKGYIESLLRKYETETSRFIRPSPPYEVLP